MSWDDEAVQAYLRSLRDSVGLPSREEIACLERLRMWEETMNFIIEVESNDA